MLQSLWLEFLLSDHQTIKLDVDQIPYDVPRNLEVAISDFVAYCNNRRYHKALGNVTPSGVLDGRREEILEKRKGGSDSDNTAQTTIQSTTQRARRINT